MSLYEEFHAPFGLHGVKLPSYRLLASPPKPDKILISVCVPTWNRPRELILAVLEAYFRQKFPANSFEVILVDDASEGTSKEAVKTAVQQILEDFPEHNFRAYFLDHTRCWIDHHTVNVAFKRALGDIVVMNQMDVLPVGELLEAMWRHLSAKPNLWVCPKAYAGAAFLEWPSSYFPHEWGAAVRREYIHKIKGKNESLIKHDSAIEFKHPLQRLGVVFGEDPSIQVLHIGPSNLHRPGYPEVPDSDKRIYEGLEWTNGDWGELTPEEEASLRMTSNMMRIVENLK